jgi:hypothetical protein
MRFLYRASIIGVFALIAYYVLVSLPLVNRDAEHFGSGYFWAWLTVTLPITLRYWILPLSFSQKAFKMIYVARFTPSPFKPDEERADGRRIGAVFAFMLGFFIACQVTLHFVIGPVMNDFLNRAAQGDTWGAALLAVWLYVLQQLTFIFIFPLLLTPFTALAKSLANNAAIAVGYEFRGYVTGGYPFMSWALRDEPTS